MIHLSPGIFRIQNEDYSFDYLTTDRQLLVKIFCCTLSNVMYVFTKAFVTGEETAVIFENVYNDFVLRHRPSILISDMSEKEGGWEDSFDSSYDFADMYQAAGVNHLIIIPPKDYISYLSMDKFVSAPLPYEVYFCSSLKEAIYTIREKKLIPDKAVMGGILHQ